MKREYSQMRFTILFVIAVAFSFIFCNSTIKAQNKSGGINLSLWKNITTQPYDSLQTTYLNLGVTSRLNRLNGIGVNAISSVAAKDVNGIQISGLSNVVGGSVRGVQLSGLCNINGNNASGIIGAGIANVIGDNLQGAGISGLMNITGDNCRGLLVSGLMNITGSNSSSIEIAGLLNIEGGSSSRGVKVAGIGNIIGENLSGIAAGGLINVCGKNVNGVQIASLANIAGKQTNGLQLSALGNVSVNANGLQIAGLSNIAKELKGGQISLLNIADDVTNGVQVGLVNYSRSSAKAKFGLVNLNPSTRYQLMIFGGNTTKGNIAVRFRNELFYTMLGMGTYCLESGKKFSASTFYRTGLRKEFARNWSISGDIGFQHIETFDNKGTDNIPARMYSLQARLNVEYQMTKDFGIFASGGYNQTNRYSGGGTYEKKPIAELGIILF